MEKNIPIYFPMPELVCNISNGRRKNAFSIPNRFFHHSFHHTYGVKAKSWHEEEFDGSFGHACEMHTMRGGKGLKLISFFFIVLVMVVLAHTAWTSMNSSFLPFFFSFFHVPTGNEHDGVAYFRLELAPTRVRTTTWMWQSHSYGFRHLSEKMSAYFIVAHDPCWIRGNMRSIREKTGNRKKENIFHVCDEYFVRR